VLATRSICHMKHVDSVAIGLGVRVKYIIIIDLYLKVNMLNLHGCIN